MNVPIVVSTAPGRSAWLADCLASIHRERVTVARSRTGGELGAIRIIYEGEHWPRWVMLQDSCEVLDQKLFDLVDDVNGPALLARPPAMYLAVYERAVLDVVGIPNVEAGADRELAITHEVEWLDRYVDTAVAMGFPCPTLFDDFHDGNNRGTEFRHGRLNLVLQNDYLRKWKGTWR